MNIQDPHLSGLLLGYAVFALGILSPGPNIMAILGTSMGKGRPAGTALALGISFGSGVWGVLTWAGLSSLLTAYAAAMVVIKLAGATYLLWLAVKAFRSACTADAPNTLSDGKALRFWPQFRLGLTIQMTNPKAALTWIAGMSLALGPDAPWWVGAALILGTLAITTSGHLLYAAAFSTRPMVAGYRRARRWIDAGLGFFFCYAGVKLLTSRL